MADNPLWHETLHDHFGQYFSVDNVLYHEKTDHQDLIIFDNRAFGRVMALDGVVQTTERDEFIYHEMMTHVPLLAHGNAKHVLIIGGGDGALLREVSRHRSIENITMAEIDALAAAGVEVIALDATKRTRPQGKSLDELFAEARTKYPDQLFMADCSSIQEGLHAAEIGFDLIGTTMASYTLYCRVPAAALRYDFHPGGAVRKACGSGRQPDHP